MTGRGGSARAGSPAPSGAAAARAPTLPRREREDHPSDLVLLGEFGRAHGLRGEVRLKSHTDDPRAIADYVPLVGSDGRAYTLRTVRPAPGGVPDLLVAVVDGVSTREAAEALNQVRLSVPRDRLRPPVDEDEFLLADLIGLRVETRSGEAVGTIVAVPDYGGGDLLEIQPAQGGATALLPFTKAFVPDVDIAERRVVIDPPDDFFAPAGSPAGPEDEA
jgi:16S rRNA processing protein RimM